MPNEDRATRRTAAAQELDEHQQRTGSTVIVESLDAGLTLLAEKLYARLHEDVEQMFGLDSMLAPVSPERTKAATIAEIDLYEIAESAVFVRRARYLREDGEWYARWLTRLRLGDVPAGAREAVRIAEYAAQTAHQRRLTLTDRLSHLLAESRRAPLVLFQILPLAVQAATALAFDDRARADDLRRQQVDCLPAIADCHDCHGVLLPNGQQCLACGNPLWRGQWLSATD